MSPKMQALGISPQHEQHPLASLAVAMKDASDGALNPQFGVPGNPFLKAILDAGLPLLLKWLQGLGAVPTQPPPTAGS